MKVDYLVRLLFITSILFININCKKEIEPDNSDNIFAIELRKDTSVSPTRFNWDKNMSSSFKSYILVRSNKPIPVGLSPTLNKTEFTKLIEINESDTTEFTDLNAPNSIILHYKLYIDLGDKFIESPDVIDYPRVFIFNNFFDYISMDNDTSWTYLYNTKTFDFIVFDYAKNEIIAEKVLNMFSLGINLSVTSGYDGSDKVLFISDYSSIYKFEMPSLKLINKVGSFTECYSLISNRNGLLISTNNDKNNSINIWRQSDISRIYSEKEYGYQDSRLLRLLDPNTNRVIEVSNNHFYAFNITQNTGIISNTFGKSLSSVPLLPQIVTSSNNQYFISFVNGDIYDKNLKLFSDILPLGKDFTFSTDMKFVYVVNTDFIMNSIIKKYSFPEMKFINEMEIPSTLINRISEYNNAILIFGFDNKDNHFIYKKINI